MNKELFKQSGNEKIKEGELPELLKGGVVFFALTRPPQNRPQAYISKYRRKLYSLMDEYLKDSGISHTHSLYSKWFRNPEWFVTGAFLERKRKEPEKWQMVVNAMYNALTEALIFAIEDVREQIRDLRDQDEMLSKHLINYEKEVQNA